MPVLLEALWKPVLVVVLLLATVAGFYFMYEHMVAENAKINELAAQKADAEHDRDTAIDAAASNAAVTVQVAKEYDRQITQINKEKDAAVKRATTATALLTEIQHEQSTSVCSQSAPVADALGGLRAQYAAARAASNSDPAASQAQGR